MRRTILVMAIQASCQMTGVSAIQYFSPAIFGQLGIPTGRTLLFQAVNAIIAFAGTSVCILTIDSVGRRPLEIYGCLFLCVTFIINAAIIKVFPTSSGNTSAHWAFVAFTWLFNFGMSCSAHTLGPADPCYSLLHIERTAFLGDSCRAFRHCDALEGRLVGSNGS